MKCSSKSKLQRQAAQAKGQVASRRKLRLGIGIPRHAAPASQRRRRPAPAACGAYRTMRSISSRSGASSRSSIRLNSWGVGHGRGDGRHISNSSCSLSGVALPFPAHIV